MRLYESSDNFCSSSSTQLDTWKFAGLPIAERKSLSREIEENSVLLSQLTSIPTTGAKKSSGSRGFGVVVAVDAAAAVAWLSPTKQTI